MGIPGLEALSSADISVAIDTLKQDAAPGYAMRAEANARVVAVLSFLGGQLAGAENMQAIQNERQ